MMRRDARAPFGERSGLVDHERVDFFEDLERFGIFHQHASERAASGADHDGHGRCESQARKGRR